MAGIPSLKPEDEKRLHPEALEWFYARRNEIQFEVPLEELSDDDLNTFLLDDEKREFQSCMEEISKGLATCTDMDEASHDLVTTASIGLSLVKFQVNSLLSMQKIAAKLAAQEYNQSLNKEKARLKTLLCPNRKDHESYFRKQIKDCRYTGQSFTQYLSSEEEQAFDKTIVDISRKKLDEIVSSDFRQFIDSKCWRSYFLLPSADYSLEGVPCLDFMFDVFAVVETRVWLKPGQKNFGDNIFDLPWREERGYSVLLQEPEFLGYYYLVLTPEELGGYSFRQSIPLVLLKGLLNGETKPTLPDSNPRNSL